MTCTTRLPSRQNCRRFRPLVEVLENRLAPALGIPLVIENFSSDADPSQPGFATTLYNSVDAQGQPVQLPAFQHNITGGHSFEDFSGWDLPSTPEAHPSLPHAMFLFGTDVVTFPALAADELIQIARVNFAAFSEVIVTFHGLTDTFTASFNPTPIWHALTVTSSQPGDHGNAIGPIQSITLFSFESLFDNVTISVQAERNTPPQAYPDFAAVRPGESVSFASLLDNDTDIDAHFLTVTSVVSNDPVALGEVISINGAPTHYTADADAHGVETLTYTIDDGHGGTATSMLTITVNEPPVAFDKRYDRLHGDAGSFTMPAPELRDLLSDLDGDPLTLFLTQDGQHGHATINQDGSFTYTSTELDGRIVDDYFLFAAGDGFTVSNSAAITIAVSNDAPVAIDERSHYNHGETLIHGNLFNLVTDAEGDPLAVLDYTLPRHGRLTVDDNGDFNYERTQPASEDGFDFTVTDGYAASNTARIEFVWDNLPPQAEDDYYLAPTGLTALDSILENDIEPDGDPLEAVLIRPPAHGHVVLNPDGSFTYETSVAVFERDSFTYRIFDGIEASNEATVTLYQDIGTPILRSDSYSIALGSGPAGRAVLDLLHGAPTPLVNDSFSTGFPLLTMLRAVRLLSKPTAIMVSPTYGTGQIRLDDLPGDFASELDHVLSDSEFRIEDDGGFAYYSRFERVDTFEYYLEYSTFDQAPGELPHRSATATVLIHVTGTPQLDSDGVDDAVEDQGPNQGDANGDGVPDSQQANVATLHSGFYLTLVSSPGTKLFDVAAVDLPAPLPAGVAMPLGTIDYTVVGLESGGAATITMLLADGVHPTTYYKYGPRYDVVATPEDESDPHWYEFLYDGTTGAELLDTDADGLTDQIVLHFVDGRRGDDDLDANGVITDPGGPALRPMPSIIQSPPPTIESIRINDGSVQRSIVKRITVRFNEAVTLDAGAFALRRTKPRRGVLLPTLNVATSMFGGKTVAVLTFSGPGVVAGSLPDGDYRLVIHGNRIHNRSGQALDGDRDGRPGGDAVTAFFRRYGDIDGDGDFDRRDRRLLKHAFGKRAREAGYHGFLDANGDRVIDQRDLCLWRTYAGLFA